jgi:cell division protein YceG involved in septum cleavage
MFRKRYNMHKAKKRRPLRRLLFVTIIALLVLAVLTVVIRHTYDNSLRSVSNSQTIKLVTISNGESTDKISTQLYKMGLVRSTWVFEWYVRSREVRDELQAGTYALRPSEDIQQIAAQLIKGEVATKLVTILPDQRLDQIKQSLINAGFSPTDVEAALTRELS